MSKFTLTTTPTGEEKARLEDVTFCYTMLQGGSYKYQSKTEKEYSVDCIVDKATAKAYKKAFPKNGYKEIETKDFEGIFKIKPPYPEQDEQYRIKLAIDCALKSDVESQGLSKGDLVPYKWRSRPKAYVPTDGGVKDITMTTLIGNGSTGDVALNTTENTFGKFPQMSGILVKDLIEYSKAGADSDFGEVVGGVNPGDGNLQQTAQEPAQEPTQQESQQGHVTPEPPVMDDFDEDQIPF